MLGFGGSSAHIPVNGLSSASVLVLNSTGSGLLATYGPVPNVTLNDIVSDFEADGANWAWVTGDDRGLQSLPSTTFYQGTSRGGVEAVVLRFNSSGVINAASYVGGGGDDTGLSIAKLGESIVVSGKTTSANLFPTPANGPQSAAGLGRACPMKAQ